MSKRLSPQGANECSLSTPAGTSTNPHSYENRNDEGAHGGGIETKKKKLQRREAAAFGDVGVLPIPQGIHWIIDGRFCAFWSADLQSILDVRDLFQRAVGPGVSVLRVWFARMGLDGHLGKGDTGNSGPRRLFAPSGLPFPSFFFFSLLLFYTLPFLTPSPRNTTCTTFHTVVRGGSAGPLGEKIRASLGRRGVHPRIPQMTPP